MWLLGVCCCILVLHLAPSSAYRSLSTFAWLVAQSLINGPREGTNPRRLLSVLLQVYVTTTTCRCRYLTARSTPPLLVACLSSVPLSLRTNSAFPENRKLIATETAFRKYFTWQIASARTNTVVFRFSANKSGPGAIKCPATRPEPPSINVHARDFIHRPLLQPLSAVFVSAVTPRPAIAQQRARSLCSAALSSFLWQ